MNNKFITLLIDAAAGYVLTLGTWNTCPPSSQLQSTESK